MVKAIFMLGVLALTGLVLAAGAPVAAAPNGLEWGPLRWSMSETDARQALGDRATSLAKPARIGSFIARFQGEPIDVAGVALKPLPLFHKETGRLGLVILSRQAAGIEDFVRLYNQLSQSYGEARISHSQIVGEGHIFDVGWHAGATAVALYYDQVGALVTLEVSQGSGFSAEPFGQKPWLMDDVWADICRCGLPIYYYACRY